MGNIITVADILNTDTSYTGVYGLKDFDNLAGKINQGQIIVVGSSAGVGKTTLLAHFTAVNLKNDKKILYITCGDSNYNIWRAVSESFFNLNRELNNDENINLIKNKLLFTESNCELSDLSELIEPLLKNKNIDIIVIDNIQYVTVKDTGRHNDQLRIIMHKIREWSNAYKIPFIISSNTNRNNTTYAEFSTTLRGSAEIEEIADTIIILNRPEYNDITHDEYGNSLLGVVELHVKKNRFGKTGMYKFIDKNNNQYDYSDILVSEIHIKHNKIISEKINELIDSFNLELETKKQQTK